jgi:hypothetical protein
MIITSILLHFVDLLILPTVFIIWLVKRNYRRKIDWIIQILFTAVFSFYIFNTGRWDWVSYYLRYVWIVVFLFAAYFSYKKTRINPFFKRFNFKEYMSLSFIIFLTVAFSVNNFSTIKGFYFEERSLDLAFPLKNGTYLLRWGNQLGR